MLHTHTHTGTQSQGAFQSLLFHFACYIDMRRVRHNSLEQNSSSKSPPQLPRLSDGYSNLLPRVPPQLASTSAPVPVAKPPSRFTVVHRSPPGVATPSPARAARKSRDFASGLAKTYDNHNTFTGSSADTRAVRKTLLTRVASGVAVDEFERHPEDEFEASEAVDEEDEETGDLGESNGRRGSRHLRRLSISKMIGKRRERRNSKNAYSWDDMAENEPVSCFCNSYIFVLRINYLLNRYAMAAW